MALLALGTALGSGAGAAEAVRAEAVAAVALPATLPAHPRLIAPGSDWAALPARRAADPELDAYCSALVAYARAELARPVPERVLQGRRLLFVSRQLIHTTLLCAFAYRVTGEEAFLQRARADMLAVAAFTDWNPSHFLDVAEMATGVALGYDWLHASLSPEDRAVLRGALVDKALRLVENGHHTLSLPNNWAQVCGGGMALAALAVAEEEPALAAKVLGRVRAGASRPLAVYAPEGAYPEGPSYWNYGTLYQAVLVSALRGALGEDWGIMASPGLLRSALYKAHTTGPTGLLFNYADCGERDGINEPLCFMAKELGQPQLALNTRRLLATLPVEGEGRPDRLAPLIVFWWPFGAASGNDPERFFTAQGSNPLACWRSSWTDPRARYFALKAGGAGVSHGHMDAGSFVLDWRGQRWSSDLGMQEYHPLEARGIKLWDMGQSSQRWSVFRLSAEAHSTLSVEGSAHSAKAQAILSHADASGALVDLSPALFLPEGTLRRRATVTPEAILLEDTVKAAKPGLALRWAMTTGAAIAIDGRRVTLSRGGESLVLEVEGEVLSLASEDISAPRAEFDVANPGMRQLVLRLRTSPEGEARLRVRFLARE